MSKNLDNMQYWNKIYSNIKDNKPTYDMWLEKFNDILEEKKNTKIVDLGCGSGGDSLYLFERGYEVIACDYSEEALKIVNKFIPNIDTIKVDLSGKLPFESNSVGIVIADLSIHYFNDESTRNIIEELKRIITKEGYLICRVNSINDVNYGAMQGDEIEKHFYKAKDGFKRFFDEKDIVYYFKEWNIKYSKECKMTRYGSEKSCFEIILSNIKQ